MVFVNEIRKLKWNNDNNNAISTVYIFEDFWNECGYALIGQRKKINQRNTGNSAQHIGVKKAKLTMASLICLKICN